MKNKQKQNLDFCLGFAAQIINTNPPTLTWLSGIIQKTASHFTQALIRCLQTKQETSKPVSHQRACQENLLYFKQNFPNTLDCSLEAFQTLLN